MFRALIWMCECILQGTEGLSHFCGFLPAPDCLADSETLLRTFPPKCWPQRAWISGNFGGNIPGICNAFWYYVVASVTGLSGNSWNADLLHSKSESCNDISLKNQASQIPSNVFSWCLEELVFLWSLSGTWWIFPQPGLTLKPFDIQTPDLQTPLADKFMKRCIKMFCIIGCPSTALSILL